MLSLAVLDDANTLGLSASAHGTLSPAPPTRTEVLAVLKAVRGRAAIAAAATGDTNNGSSGSHGHGGSNVYNRRDDDQDDGDIISSPAALEAAFEATDVSDENLRALANVLAATANVADCSFQLAARRGSTSATSAEQGCRLAHWTAIARALILSRWPPPGSIPPMAVPRQGLGPVTSDDTLSVSDSVRLLRRWHGLRLPVPCKYLLAVDSGGSAGGERASVTCLAYLPLSMLLVSGYSDGKVRLWDPCARKHKLAPPPPPPAAPATRAGGWTAGGDENRGRGGLGRRRGRHLRLFPGSYAETAEEWTEKGQTFGCVATFYAARAAAATTTTAAGTRGGVAGGDGGGLLKVGAVDSIVVPGGGVSSLVVCNPESARDAQAMDEEQPWDPASAGECVTGSAFGGITGGCLLARKLGRAIAFGAGLSSSHTLASVVDNSAKKNVVHTLLYLPTRMSFR